MSRRPFTRRQFLRGAGGVVVGLPLLPSLLPREARAQASPPIKRLVVFFHPNGVIPHAWWPTPGATDRDFVLNRSHASALQPYREKLLYLRGVDMLTGKQGPGERHQSGMGTLLSGMPLLAGTFVGGDGSLAGWGSGITIDQRIANVIGAATPLGSLQLGVRASGGEVRHRLSYTGPAEPLPPENDPRAVFDVLFRDFQTDPDELARIRRQKKSVLDAVMEQFAITKRSLSRADLQKVDRHLTMVRELESRIAMVNPGQCEVPAEPAPLEIDSEATMPAMSRLMIDLMTVAFACDLTRVVVLQYSNAENHIRFPWLNSLGDGHALSHAGPSSMAEAEEVIQRDTWYAEQLAYLLGGLQAIDESGTSALDSSVVFYCNELAVGNTHSHVEMPFLLAGSAGGAFRTGRLLQYDHASHCNLLLSLVNAMGVPDQVFGMPAYCSGPLAGLA